MSVIIKLIVGAFLLVAVKAANTVLPVEKCNLEDSKCLVKAFQQAMPIFIDGIPELNVDVLDELEMDPFKFDLSGLQFGLKDGRLKGLKTAVFDDVKWDTKKETIEVDFHMNCTVKGHYTAAGRILILPITGDGDMKLKLRNVHIKITLTYKTEKDTDGSEVIIPTKYSFEYEVLDHAHFKLTNLFNGNKELSDTMLTFLNENWKVISQEFGQPMMDAAAKKLFQNVKRFFKKSPIDEIAQRA